MCLFSSRQLHGPYISYISHWGLMLNLFSAIFFFQVKTLFDSELLMRERLLSCFKILIKDRWFFLGLKEFISSVWSSILIGFRLYALRYRLNNSVYNIKYFNEHQAYTGYTFHLSRLKFLKCVCFLCGQCIVDGSKQRKYIVNHL